MKIKDFLKEICVINYDSDNDIYQYGFEFFLPNITNVNGERFLIEAEWDVADTILNAGEVEINLEGYLVYYYIYHDSYFYLERMKEKKDVENFIIKFKDNMFFADITVFFDGELQRYDYKDGKIYWLD